MRKTTILLTVLLLVCGALFVTAHITVNNQQDRVTWDETTLFGDKAAAAGLTVQTQNTLDTRQLWQTAAVLGQTPRTQFRSSLLCIKEAARETYDGIILSVDEMLPWTASYLSWLDKDTQVRYQPLTDYCQMLTDRLPPDTSKSFTLNLREFMNYYPLDGWFDLPGMNDISWHQQQMTVYNTPTPAWNAFNDYFKIPILGEYTLKVEAYKNTQSSISGFTEVTALYLPDFHGVTTEDTCYFTFDTVAEDGQIADCSQIPGGYGLYSFRYTLNEKDEAEPDMDSLTTAISLDPSESYATMWLTEEKDRLLLLTTKDSKELLTVIDLETMTCLQKTELSALSGELDLHIRQGAGFLAVFIRDPKNEGHDTVSVFAERADGTYEPAFTAALNTDGFSTTKAMLDGFSTECVMAFDGTRLALAQNCMELTSAGDPLRDSCDFYIVVYDAGGMAYAGKYDVNLSDINRSGSELVCTPFGSQPITIGWEN